MKDMQMGQIREMLEYAKVGKETLALFSEEATQDEKIVAQYKDLRKRQIKDNP